MANMQTECLNEKCSTSVTGRYKWCSIDCKKAFLVSNYSDGQCHVWFKEANKDFIERRKRVMAEIKESGLTVTEFLHQLGDFKKDPVQIEGEKDEG